MCNGKIFVKPSTARPSVLSPENANVRNAREELYRYGYPSSIIAAAVWAIFLFEILIDGLVRRRPAPERRDSHEEEEGTSDPLSTFGHSRHEHDNGQWLH